MVDEDKGKAQDHGKFGDDKPDDAKADPATSEQPSHVRPVPPNQDAAARPSQSEWTVSDRRGPMDKAETDKAAEDEDVERFVPAHETDAVGVEDHAMPPPAPVGGQDESFAEQPTSRMSYTDEAPRSNEPIYAAAPEPAPPPAMQVPPPARSSALPIIGGLIGGAVVGAAVAALIFANSNSAAGDDGRISALDSRLQAVERPDLPASLGRLQVSLADFGHRVILLERNAPARNAAPAPAAGQNAPQAPAASPPSTPAETGLLHQKIFDTAAGLDKLQNRMKGLESQIAQSRDLAGKLSTLEAAVSGAQKQASTAQSSVEAVEAQQKSLEGKIGTPALAVVTDSLVQQIDHGEPFVTHVDALASLGADSTKVAVLKQYADKGVPSAATLAAKFAPLAEPMVAATHQAAPNAGMLDRLKSGMAGLVTVRRSDSATGNDVASRVSRIETSLAHGDVTEAYETWNLLPAEAKTKSEAWGALAKTSAVARAAARGLQREAIISLGVKKS